MKNQALFSSKHKSKKIKCHLLHFLFGTLRVSFQNIPKTLDPFYNNPKNLDPSYKMDLEFRDCFGRDKTI